MSIPSCDHRNMSAIRPVSCLTDSEPHNSPSVNVGSPMDSSSAILLGRELRRLTLASLHHACSVIWPTIAMASDRFVARGHAQLTKFLESRRIR